MPAVDIIELGEDGGFDLTDVPEQQEPQQQQQQLGDFLASKKWSGRKPGFAFKTGSKGTGYYLDPKSALFTPPASAQRATAPTKPKVKKIAPPSDEKVSCALWHRKGVSEPHSVEVTVELGSQDFEAVDVNVSGGGVGVGSWMSLCMSMVIGNGDKTDKILTNMSSGVRSQQWQVCARQSEVDRPSAGRSQTHSRAKACRGLGTPRSSHLTDSNRDCLK